MWYRKDYPGGPIGASDALDMTDAFQDFYAEEKHEHPEDAKELAMFQYAFTESGGVQYFHTKSIYHDGFFSKHGCSLHSKIPIPVPIFIDGDKDFAESLLSKK